MPDATSATKVAPKTGQAIRRAFLGNPIGLGLGLACILIAAICLVTGLRIDAKSMGVNLLAGLVCTALGIPLAIWVIDRYLKYVARRRWSRVDTLTYRAIAAHLCDSAVEILIGMDVLKDLRPTPEHKVSAMERLEAYNAGRATKKPQSQTEAIQ